MDEKAANKGDRLKHALLLEVLERTRGWPGVVYAETHAGAGVYDAKNQREPTYIHNLRKMVMQVQATNNGPGLAYLTWLRKWWGIPDKNQNQELYPGSAVTAASWLQSHRPTGPFDIRLTEKDAGTCERLKGAVASIANTVVKQESFDELDWLTGGVNLVLLVDPFGCVKSFEDSEDRGIHNGWIDHDTVKNILKRCAEKQRAVVSLWWSSAHALREHHKPNCDLLTSWAHQHGNAVCRVFHDNSFHANALVGIGCGANVVWGLPGGDDWKKSWLKDTVYELKDTVYEK
jgi:23S rRNA A2030 N6-methylase RlmJ